MVDTHIQRVRDELKAAGMTKYGMLKFATRYLPRIIHDHEHIRAVVYGHYKQDNSPIPSEGMLVATDRRVIFINRRPMYTSVDELSYEIVAGLNISQALFFSSISLYTRMSNYTIRYANKNCANRFAEYVEHRRLSGKETTMPLPVDSATPPPPLTSPESMPPTDEQ